LILAFNPALLLALKIQTTKQLFFRDKNFNGFAIRTFFFLQEEL